MKIFDIINEEHFNLSSNEEPTKPFKNDDTITVYHGFRDIDDAILTVKHGTSGALRVSRVYSYESDNNPKGLFVTPNLNTAKNFGNTIIEFDSRFDELEPPVWPSGSYTGYGQYSQYWGRGREGRAKRSKAQTQLLATKTALIACASLALYVSGMTNNGTTSISRRHRITAGC